MKRKVASSDQEVMTVAEVADYLKCHIMTIYRLAKSGTLPAFRLGTDWRFLRSAVDKWIANQEVRPSVSKSGGRGRGERGARPKLDH